MVGHSTSTACLHCARTVALIVVALLLAGTATTRVHAQEFGEPAEIRVQSARVRTEPSIVSSIVHTLVLGSAVRVTSPGEIWSFIEFGEIRGYVRTEQLLMIRPPVVDSSKVRATIRPTRETAASTPTDAAPRARTGRDASVAGWRLEGSGLLRSFPYGPSIGSRADGVRLGDPGVGGELLVRAPLGARISLASGVSVSVHEAARLATPGTRRVAAAAFVIEPRLHQPLLGGLIGYVAPRFALQRLSFATAADSTVSPYATTHLGGSVSLGGGVERAVTERVSVVGGTSYALALHTFRAAAGATAPLGDPLLGNTEWTGRLGVSVRF